MAALSTAHARPWWGRAADGALLVAFAVTVAALAWRDAAALDLGPRWLAIALALPAGLAAADLASGLAHWWGDTYFGERTPWLGRAVIRPFRHHHRQPQAILDHDWLAVQRNNTLLTLPLVVGLWLASPPADGFALFLHAVAVWFAVCAMGTNQLHRWAHHPHPPAPVRWLQRRRWILSPDAHRAHHRDGRRSYCVTTGWCNAILDRRGVWRALERAWPPRAARAAPAP